MRSDMQKVLTERPRVGTRYSQVVRERFFDSRDPEDDGPLRDSMSWNRNGRTKHFNDHLTPVKRFLEKQVGRLWNDVWSEVCEHASLNSVQGRHLREHIEGYVERYVIEVRNKVPYVRAPYNFYPDREGDGLRALSPGELWVHPETGILHKNGNYKTNDPKHENPDLKIIDEIYYGRRDGVWYELEMRPIARGSFYSGRDVFLNLDISGWDDASIYDSRIDKVQRFYGKPVCCIGKRQLNKKDKKKLGIK